MDFNALLALMVQKNSFDLFITAGRAPTMKIDGVLVEVSKTPLTKEQTLALVLSIMDARNKEQFHRTKDCLFAIGVPKVGHFRVNAFIQRDAAAMVLHRTRYEIPDIDSLNLPAVLKDLVMEKSGLILFVSELDFEKLTAFHSLIQYRNKHSNGHIIVIDDPMEYMHAHAGCIVTQREVGIDTDSFETALKHSLQQLPDVVAICELKSAEIVQEALRLVESHRLCLSTIQASDSTQAIEQILNFFDDDAHIRLRIELSRCLLGIISQRMVHSSDGKNHIIFEVLLATPLIKETLRRGELPRFKELIANGRSDGMQNFDQALCDLVIQEKISYEDALRAAEYKNDFRSMVNKKISEFDTQLPQNEPSLTTDKELQTSENQEQEKATKLVELPELREMTLSDENDPEIMAESNAGSIFTHR